MNPRGPLFPIELRSWMQGTSLPLLSGPPPAVTMPFAQYDWPVPRGPTPAIVLRSHLHPLQLNLLGQDSLPAGRGMSGDQPNPRGSVPAISLRHWDQNLLESTLSIVQAALPFAQYDWPNPRGPDASALRGHLHPLQLNLLGQDSLPAGRGMTAEQPNPRGAAHPVALRTHVDPLKLNMYGVLFDAVTVSNGNAAPTLTFLHTPVNAPTAVGVGVAFDNSQAISSITYGGVRMRREKFNDSPPSFTGVEIWGLESPPAGPQSVVVTFAGNVNGVTAGAVTVTQSDPTQCFDYVAQNTTNSASPSINTPSSVWDLVFDVNARTAATLLSAGAGQTIRWNLAASTVRSSASTKQASSGSTTSSYTLNGATNFGMVSASFKWPQQWPLKQTDWPNPPRGPQQGVISLKTHTDGNRVLLFSRDAMTASRGMTNDQPNPRGAAYPLSLRTFTLFPAQGMFVAPIPFAQYSWPVPRGPEFAVALRTFTDPLKLNLHGQDALPVSRGMPPTPNPRGPEFPSSLRGFVSGFNQNLPPVRVALGRLTLTDWGVYQVALTDAAVYQLNLSDE